jgi:hypothetical protein
LGEQVIGADAHRARDENKGQGLHELQPPLPSFEVAGAAISPTRRSMELLDFWLRNDEH